MTENLIDAERPGGFLDYLPQEYIARDKMLKTIAQTFQSFGFDAIETPVVEFSRTLQGEEGDTGKQIFSISSRDTKGEELALRFDHTVPFARLLAQNPYNAHTQEGVRLPWRRMVIGPVFRGERPQKGRYRQFYQCDADIAGTDSMTADAEIIAMMYHTLVNLGVERFVVRINNRNILNGLASLMELQDTERHPVEDQIKLIMRILDKIDKIGIDNVINELCTQEWEFKIAEHALERVRAFLTIDGNNHEKLQQCTEIFEGISVAQEGIAQLQEVLALLEAQNIDVSYIAVDFSIARGLDYYTGTVMETNLLDALEFGSVFSGGRYDGLVKRFTGQDLPAVGTSIGVDRLFAALQHLHVIDDAQKTVADIMVLRIQPDQDAFYLALAQKLRMTGKNVVVNMLRDTTFKQQFNFALTSGVRYVVICGENEMSQNIVQIKDLVTREQRELAIDDILTFFES